MTNLDPPSSRAAVETDRPARYGKQLAAHLGRRVESAWNEESGDGYAVFPFGRADLTATDEGLTLYVVVAPDAETELQGDAGLDRLEDVVGRHLVRFGSRDELTVSWMRSNGSPGSVQVSPGEEPQDSAGHVPGP